MNSREVDGSMERSCPPHLLQVTKGLPPPVPPFPEPLSPTVADVEYDSTLFGGIPPLPQRLEFLLPKETL